MYKGKTTEIIFKGKKPWLKQIKRTTENHGQNISRRESLSTLDFDLFTKKSLDSLLRYKKKARPMDEDPIKV